MKWKKLTALFLAMAMMVTMLTACGGGGGSISSQVEDYLNTIGYDIDVSSLETLDNAVRAYIDSEERPVIRDTYDSAEEILADTMAQTLIVGNMMGWFNPDGESSDTVGIVFAFSDETLKTGIDLSTLPDTEMPEAIKKLGKIDTPEKVIAMMIASIEQSVSCKDYKVSVAQAETESGKPAWVIAIQFTYVSEGEQ